MTTTWVEALLPKRSTARLLQRGDRSVPPQRQHLWPDDDESTRTMLGKGHRGPRREYCRGPTAVRASDAERGRCSARSLAIRRSRARTRRGAAGSGPAGSRSRA